MFVNYNMYCWYLATIAINTALLVNSVQPIYIFQTDYLIMKALYYLLISIILLGVSCENNDIKNNDADLITSSLPFLSLGISEDLLDLTNIQSQTTPAGHQVLVISYKDNRAGKMILNFLNEQRQITVSTLAEVESSISPENYSTSFDEKKFNAKLSFLNSTGLYFGFEFKESNIENIFLGINEAFPAETTAVARTNQSQECKPLTKKGGALDCAGASLQADGPFSKASCYFSFMPCMLWKVMDCIYSGCVMPVNPGSIVIDGKTIATGDTGSPVNTVVPVVKPTKVVNIDPDTFK